MSENKTAQPIDLKNLLILIEDRLEFLKEAENIELNNGHKYDSEKYEYAYNTLTHFGNMFNDCASQLQKERDSLKEQVDGYKMLFEQGPSFIIDELNSQLESSERENKELKAEDMRNSETLMWNEQAIDSLKSKLSSIKEQAEELAVALERNLHHGKYCATIQYGGPHDRCDCMMQYDKEILSTYKQSKGE